MDYPGRQSRLAAVLRQHKLAGLLVTHLPNIRYLCGFTGSAGVLAISADPRSPKATFFTDGRYTQQAREEVVGARAVIAKSAAITAAVEWLMRHDRRASIGFEADHMTVSSRASLGQIASGLRLKPASLVETLRAVKEPAEVTQIRAAVNLASAVFEGVLPDIK